MRGAGTAVAWILVAGALSVALVMGAWSAAGLLLDEDRGSTPGRLDARPLAGMGRALRVAARARLLLPRRKAPLEALAAGRGGRGPGLRGSDAPAPLPAAARRAFRSGPQPARGRHRLRSAAHRLLGLLWFGILIGLAGGALSLRARYRGGDAARRRQVLWLAYAPCCRRCGSAAPLSWTGSSAERPRATCSCSWSCTRGSRSPSRSR